MNIHLFLSKADDRRSTGHVREIEIGNCQSPAQVQMIQLLSVWVGSGPCRDGKSWSKIRICWITRLQKSPSL